jgi:tetratricopeptide (TPR) repeat protein
MSSEDRGNLAKPDRPTADSRPPNGADNGLTCPRCAAVLHNEPAAAGLVRCDDCHFVYPSRRPTADQDQNEDSAGLIGPPPGLVIRERYRLHRRIGRGGQGIAYLAEHLLLGAACVVKFLPHPVAASDEPIARRLRDEARAGFRVSDPNVVRVLDCGQHEGWWYLVAEHVASVDLRAITDAGVSMAYEQVALVGRSAALGLSAIHRAGLLHGDITPANLLLVADGRVRIADLGVAALYAAARNDSSAVSVAAGGTPAFAAPELFDPQQRPDARSDLYALGLVLHQLATGRLPHRGGLLRSLLDAQDAAPSWPADAPPGAPAWLTDAILRLLRGQPSQRFAAADALADALADGLHAPRGRPSSAARAAARPSPGAGGIAILPLQNERPSPDDDWLGIALADGLERGVAHIPGVYVADGGRLAELLQTLERRVDLPREMRLLETGRLVGAATIIEGRFARSDDAITCSLRTIRPGGGVHELGRFDSPVARLADLQSRVLKRLLTILELTEAQRRAAPSAAGSVSLAAQEHFVRGRQSYLRGEYDAAIELARRAADLDPEFGEAIGFAGICAARLGRYDEAERRHHQQETLATQTGDQRLWVEAQANLGVMNYFRGELSAAHECYDRAAARAAQLGLASEEAQIRNNLGFVLFRLGRPAEAEAAFLRAIQTHEQYGALSALIAPCSGLGNVLLSQQRYDQAQERYRRALELAEALDDRVNVGLAHTHLGRCATLAGRWSDARHELTLGLNILEATSFWNGLAQVFEHMADLNLRLGHFLEAARCADRRIELAQRHANRRTEAAAWRQKADALRAAGQPAEADDCLRRAE